MSDLFIHLFIALFVIADPFGLIPYFLALTPDSDQRQRRIIISKAIIFAFLVLVVFAALGKYILEYLSLSIASFKVAGGLLLLFIAFEMILGYPKFQKDKGESLALTPLAIPLLAGPGAIATVIIYTTQFSGILNLFTALSAIFLALFLAWLVLIGSENLFKILKKEGSIALAKLMGLILAALAIEMIFNGIKSLIS